MAGFHTKTFLKHDDYMTPRYAWENIKQYIPKDKVIWEPFYGDGTSGEILKDMGFDVIHNKENFYDFNKGDIVLSNPPFSDKKNIILRLLELDKPFILLMPQATLNNNYIKIPFATKKLQLIVPRKRIHFIKNGTEQTNKCNFDCFYFCYKMNLENDIIFLE
jgi:hypothetical protein